MDKLIQQFTILLAHMGQNYPSLFYSIAWLLIGVVVAGIVFLIWYIHREIKKYPSYQETVLPKDLEPSLKNEFGNHKKAVDRLTTTIEQTRINLHERNTSL